jgi:hypothetical protein
MMSKSDSFVFDEIPTQEQLLATMVNKARKRKVETGVAEYGLTVRRSVRGLWKGYFNVTQFINMMSGAIRIGFTHAWHDGIATCGFKPGDMTVQEHTRLQSEINSEIFYVVNFANAIREGDQIAGGKLTPLIERSQMWGARYSYIYDLARTYACGDKKYKWVMGNTKEHCRSCLILNGKVYRASTWRQYNLVPRSHGLDCGGYHCLCYFLETIEPLTPGIPPIVL